MKIRYYPDGGGVAIEMREPYAGAKHVEAPGACPNCKASPLSLAGVAGTTREGHDTITGDAGCTNCRAVIGRLVVTIDTIFGLEEDRAVLCGRPRVY